MKNINRIGLVTFPISKAGLIPLRHLVQILSTISDNLSLITGNEGYEYYCNEKSMRVYGIKHETRNHFVGKAWQYLITQTRFALKILAISKDVDFFIFFIGGSSLFLPMLAAKLIRKKVVLSLAGSDYSSARLKNWLSSLPIFLLTRINYLLSNVIIVYGPSLVKEYGLQKHRLKTSIAHEHFLDFNRYVINKHLNERVNLIGYIGRMGEEKGVLNLTEALDSVFEACPDSDAVIIGDGRMRQIIENILVRKKLTEKVNMPGWIDHDELPCYLNKLKLLVIPSYTEGLPNIMLEAMACGTPVLATPVGAIPDFLTDGETGFIMENNSPECISKNIIRALNHPRLEKITNNARTMVLKKFTFEKAVENYRRILEQISHEK